MLNKTWFCIFQHGTTFLPCCENHDINHRLDICLFLQICKVLEYTELWFPCVYLLSNESIDNVYDCGLLEFNKALL
jgi:hypothetical protein